MTTSPEQWLFPPSDTGERRRTGDPRPVIGDLIDEATIDPIAQESWISLIGEEEVLLPLPSELPDDVVSSWVEDVADAFGEIADAVGGNVEAALPGPSGLSLPHVGDAPAVRNAADHVRVDVLWRGVPVSISVQGALPALPVRPAQNENEVPL